MLNILNMTKLLNLWVFLIAMKGFESIEVFIGIKLYGIRSRGK